MVYESDFYTTRRPYRATPSVSSYTVSQTVPSRQIRILPGIGKVHVVHSYDRIIPYIGHKRITVIPSHGRSHAYRVRPSVIVRELDRIAHKARPYIYYTPSLTHSEPLTYFDNEASLIRAQSNLLLKTLHAPVARLRVPWPSSKVSYWGPYTPYWGLGWSRYNPYLYSALTASEWYRYYYNPYSYDLPLARITSPDDYIHRMLTPIKSVKNDIYKISHYITEPIRRYIGPSHLACVRYSGDKAYSRRRNLTLQEIYSMQSDTVRNDIQLLSYYINANKERKAREGTGKASGTSLNSMRPSRHFSKPQMMLEPSVSEEVKELREQRAERMRKIQELEDAAPAPAELEASRIKRATKKQEEERALAEEKAKKEAAAKKEEEARRAELARQEALAAQAAAERQAELDRQAELAKKAAEEKAAEEARVAAEKAAAAAAEKARVEAEKAAAEAAAAEAAEKARIEEEKRQEEERQALLRLEEIARQAEEEKERELARQAEELAELARQEAELAEQAKREAELAELAKQEAELAELERQEKELAELDRQEREAAEAGKEEAELAEQEKDDAEVAAAESNIPAEEATSEPEPVTSPEPAAEADVTSPEPEPEPLIEEPATPEVEEDAE